MPVDLAQETDEKLDDILLFLYSQHREALGKHKDDVHTAIMLVLAEQSRRLAAWLESLPPVPSKHPSPGPLVNH